MKVSPKIPPRPFKVGIRNETTISDCGEIHLEPDELVTFVTANGSRFDFSRKDWGFYATPSVNRRLVDQGFRTAIVKNSQGAVFIMVIEKTHMDKFDQYLKEDKQEVVQWLDIIPLE